MNSLIMQGITRFSMALFIATVSSLYIRSCHLPNTLDAVPLNPNNAARCYPIPTTHIEHQPELVDVQSVLSLIHKKFPDPTTPISIGPNEPVSLQVPEAWERFTAAAILTMEDGDFDKVDKESYHGVEVAALKIFDKCILHRREPPIYWGGEVTLGEGGFLKLVLKGTDW